MARHASLANVLCGPFAAFVVVLAGVFLVGHHQLAVDFRASYLPAAEDVLHGRSPFPRHAAADIGRGVGFLYPPLAAWLTVPFLAFPAGVAGALATLLALAAVPAALLLLGVRDWRCYGCAFLWAPVLQAIQSGNVTIPLLLALACAWRWRRHAWVVGGALGFAIALKLFLVPLAVWLLATRRYRALAVTAGSAAALVLVPWAAIGFRGLGGYPALVHLSERIEAQRSYSLVGLVHSVGGAPSAGLLLSWVAAAMLVAAAFVLGRSGGDRKAFVAALAAGIVATPILWLHYLALLLVAVALLRPRLGWVWWLPVGLWLCPARPPSPFEAILATAIVAALLAETLTDRLRAPFARVVPGIPALRQSGSK